MIHLRRAERPATVTSPAISPGRVFSAFNHATRGRAGHSASRDGQDWTSRHPGRSPIHALARISADARPGHSWTRDGPSAPPVRASTAH